LNQLDSERRTREAWRGCGHGPVEDDLPQVAFDVLGAVDVHELEACVANDVLAGMVRISVAERVVPNWDEPDETVADVIGDARRVVVDGSLIAR
jgi:hypothetical protein